jgi:hypothetical protein
MVKGGFKTDICPAMGEGGVGTRFAKGNMNATKEMSEERTMDKMGSLNLSSKDGETRTNTQHARIN